MPESSPPPNNASRKSHPSTPPNNASRKSQWAGEVRTRLSTLRLSPTREAEIVDELSQHLDQRYLELIAGGASPEDASRLALAEFRSNEMLAQQMAPLQQSRFSPPLTPAAPTGHLLGDLWQDLRYAARIFRKQTAFAATAVLTLALGIGATTAIFSVVYGVLLKPLPFAEPEALVSLRQHAPHGAGTNHGPTTYLTYRENQSAFEAIGAWDPTDVSITGGGDPERVQALLVSSSTLPLLRVQPVIGRAFGADDDTPGQPLRVVLTHGYWQRRFGGAENTIGQRISIDGRSAEVIGVLPPSFTFLRTNPSVLLPMPLDAAAPRGISFGFQALARLKPGLTLARANDDIARMISLLPPSFARLELQPNVQALSSEVIGDVAEMLWILLAAVAVVLLIACGNVANLFLVRAEGRHQELAMRAALGASRGRIARVLLSESMVLALAGGVVGVALAEAAIGLLRTIAPAELPRVNDIDLNPAVLLFSLVVSLLSGLLFGVFAVLRFGSPTAMALKEGGRGSSDAPGRHRTRNALVVGQIALALTLLIVSGLMIRTSIAMRQVDPGFTQPDQVQTFVVAIPASYISDGPQAARTHERVAEQLSRIAGVTSVGLATSITMDGEDNGNYVMVEGFPDPQGPVPLRRLKSFAPGYLETIGARLVAGRSITWSEVHEQRLVILVSATLAREYWKTPGEAIGKRVRCCNTKMPWREIVGVVGDERDDGLNRPPTPIVYFPILNESFRWRTMAYAVRSSRVGTPGFLREIEQAVWSVDRNLPLARIQTLAEIQANSMIQTSFALVMLGIAAAVALLIGVVGIYGVIAHAAAQRTREIGVRMALGAQLSDVRTLFLRHGLWLTGIGIAIGVAVAILLTRVIASYLFGVSPFDPLTYAVVSLVLATVSLVAIYLPARRAARVDPIVALRADI
jgi:putative ABC transport system permease protein